MGCGGTPKATLQGVDKPLQSQLKKTGDPEIDKVSTT